MTIPRNYNTGNNYFLIKFEIRGTSSSDWHVGAMMDTQLSYDRKKKYCFHFRKFASHCKTNIASFAFFTERPRRQPRDRPDRCPNGLALFRLDEDGQAGRVLAALRAR